MKILCALLFGVAVLAATSRADGLIDQVDEALTFSAAHDQIRGRLSGTLDVETYYFRDGDPGLIYSDKPFLFNPRVTLFFDGQLGGDLYIFIQTRFDRGFDPNDERIRVRVDEYALRYTPWEDGRLQFQLGKFATVFGNWVERHLSWDNPFMGAPLAYENVTAMWDSEAAPSLWQLRAWGYLDPPQWGQSEHVDKLKRLPIIWGPSYATGAAVSGKTGYFEYAAEVKNASLSSRPEQWTPTARMWEQPTFSGRIGYRPNPTWRVGFSGSEGSYLNHGAGGRHGSLGAYRQIVLGQDFTFAWHHLQIWAEAFESRFQNPKIGDADVYSYYVEAKYKFAPQFFGAIRWNQEWFGHMTDPEEDELKSKPWGHDVSRIDLAGVYRFNENAQLKIQYSYQRASLGGGDNESTSAQFTIRF